MPSTPADEFLTPQVHGGGLEGAEVSGPSTARAGLPRDRNGRCSFLRRRSAAEAVGGLDPPLDRAQRQPQHVLL